MPIHEYECNKCGHKKEILTLSSADPAPLKCDCGGTFKRLVSHSSFILKGSGWYATDYADKGKKTKAKKDYEKISSGEEKEVAKPKAKEKKASSK